MRNSLKHVLLLNSADTGPTYGPELITNGNFDANTSGWSSVRSSLASISGGQSGNALEVTRTADPNGYAGQVATVEVGKSYRVRAWQKDGTASGRITIGNGIGQTQYENVTISNAVWTLNEFTVVAGTTGLGVSVYSETNGGTCLYDTISVQEIII